MSTAVFLEYQAVAIPAAGQEGPGAAAPEPGRAFTQRGKNIPNSQ